MSGIFGRINPIDYQTQIDAKAPKASPIFTGTVAGISKSMVGLGNVDNTSDMGKPVSTAQSTALAAKATTLSGYGITDATPSSHVGSTGSSHGDATTSVSGFMSAADKTKLDGPNWSFPDTQVPSADANTLDDYEESIFNPTITSFAGTLTTVSSVGSYTKIGRLVNFNFTITLTNNGTGSGYLTATVPFSSSRLAVGCYRENSYTGVMGQLLIYGSVIFIRKSDNTYPGANGYSLICSITYIV